MIADLIAAGVFAVSSGGSGEYTDTGIVTASAERTVTFAPAQSKATRGAQIPYGAEIWLQDYDPADHTPYAFNFTKLLGEGEKIAAIEAVVMNAAAALLGIEVDVSSGFSPLIDEEGGKLAQIYYEIDVASWTLASFDASGVQMPVKMRVRTDASPPNRYERTGVLTVRQL